MNSSYPQDINHNGESENQHARNGEAAHGGGERHASNSISKGPRLRRILAVLGGVVLGSLACLLAFVAMFVARRESLPPLTRAAYEAALERWQAHGPASYELDVVLEGRQPGRIHVEVRRGQVTRMTRDGIQPSQQRTWDYWTVPGQFDTLDRELEMAANPQASFNARPGSVIQQAAFDPTYGYPLHYRRFVLGTDFEVDWQVTAFHKLTDEAGHAP